MGVKDKDKSLLEIAVELLATKHQPQTILQIAKEAMEIKGLKTTQAKEILPQFLLDFQSSGYFVYIEEYGTWDLKERRPSDLKGYNDDDDDKSEEAVESKKHELNSGISADDVHAEQSQEEDEDDNQDNDDDDLDDISMILKEDGSLGDINEEESEDEEDE